MKFESAFSPGPWRVRRWDGEQWPERRISVACANGTAVLISPRYADDDQAMSDAVLAAAAPDLYDALAHIAEYWNRDQNETAMADALWHIIATAQAALVKARGDV